MQDMNSSTITRILVALAATAALSIAAVAAGFTWDGKVEAGKNAAYSADMGAGAYVISLEGEDDGADLDLYVYDAEGNLLGYDDMLDNIPVVEIELEKDQEVIIVVENAGEEGGAFTGSID